MLRIPGSTRHWATVMTIALGVLVVALAGAVTYTIAELGRQNDETRRLVRTIQSERERNILKGCQAQNRSNRATKRTLRSLTDDRRTRLFTFALLDALAPVRDCQKVLRSQTDPYRERD